MELATVSNDWMCNLTGAFGEPYETCFKLSERWRHVCSDSHMILILPHSGLHLYECWWIPKVMPHQVVKEASGQEPGCQQHGSGWGAVGLYSCGTAYHSSHWTSKGGQTDLKCKQVVPDKALIHCLIASGFLFFFLMYSYMSVFFNNHSSIWLQVLWYQYDFSLPSAVSGPGTCILSIKDDCYICWPDKYLNRGWQAFSSHSLTSSPSLNYPPPWETTAKKSKCLYAGGSGKMQTHLFSFLRLCSGPPHISVLPLIGKQLIFLSLVGSFPLFHIQGHQHALPNSGWLASRPSF